MPNQEQQYEGEAPPLEDKPVSSAYMFTSVILNIVDHLLEGKSYQLELYDRQILEKDKLWLEKQLAEMKPSSELVESDPEP